MEYILLTKTELSYLYSACLASESLSRQNGHDIQAKEFHRLADKMADTLNEIDNAK